MGIAAYPTPPPSPTCSISLDRVGHVINNRLQITGELGIGAYGVVYTAVDILDPSRRTYAVKALRKHGLEPRQQRFQNLEIDLHREASSSGHPNIVQFLQIMEDHEYKYVILEYCPEGDLFSNITDGGRYVRNDALAKSVFLQLIDAVMHCHSLEIYHRDLKPENILVTEGGSCVKLADFGLATRDRVTSDFGCGSTFYMSPECQQSSPRPFASYASAPNDVWSLGVILVNLTCGRNPWKRACLDDSTYSAYLKDRTFLNTILPITDDLNHILSMIFDPDPTTRITLPELRQMVVQCPRFTVPQQLTVPVLSNLPVIPAIPAQPPSPPPNQYDPVLRHHVEVPPSPPLTPPHTPPLCATSVPSWTTATTSPSISAFQTSCTEVGTVFTGAVSRPQGISQSNFTIVQPIPTKVPAFPATQPYVLPSGYYWFPQHISRMAGYFHQPFQQHMQQMQVFAC